jgi:hypothetical protein
VSRLDIVAFVLGFVALEYGVACWSVPAAWVLGGVLVMLAAAWPTPKVKH